MATLLIDTAGRDCAAALADGSRVVGEAVERIGTGHAERLMAVIAAAMEAAGLGYAEVDRVAVNCGPGSFTGLRVGLATARGVALALACPVVGLPCLDALALAADPLPETPLLTVLDARRGELFAKVSGASGASTGGLPREAAAMGLAELARLAEAVDGLALCGAGAPILAAALDRPVRILHALDRPPATALALLASRLPDSPERPEPLYLRAPDARPQAAGSLLRPAGVS